MSVHKTKVTPAGNYWLPVFISGLLLFGVLQFYGLGQYALWGDESYTALFAKTIRQTGDTTVLVDGGKNIITAMFGTADKLLVGMHERSNAPLPAYLIAMGMAFFGENAFGARIIPALFGFAGFLLMALSTRRLENGTLICAILTIACCCNASLLLFLRQARYFGPEIFLTVIITLIYLEKQITWRNAIVFWIATVCLYLTHYMSFFVFFVVLALDYFIFKRRLDAFPIKKAILLLLPPAAICGLFLLLLNPLQTGWIREGTLNESAARDGIGEKLTLWWWQWRDMNACGFTSYGMLALMAGAAVYFKDRWLWRCILALFAFVTLLTFVTPQVVINNTVVADVRYLVPVLPLLIVASVRALILIFGKKPILAFIVAAIVFGTNLLTGLWIKNGDFRGEIIKYAGELAHPNPEPFTPTADWIKKNIPDNATVWVMPNENITSLLFLAPGPVYAWSLPYPPAKQFEKLSPAFFRGVVPPDYIICFGPVWQAVGESLSKSKRADLQYKHIATLDYFFRDLYRPEVFWRSFEPIRNYDKNLHAIYIFQHIPAK